MSTEIKEIVTSNQPIVTDRIGEVTALVKQQIDELNIDSLIATEDTVGSLKKTRANLTSYLKIFEEQRKDIKKYILAPYVVFEEKYNLLKEFFTEADKKLKDKIDSVELELLATKKKDLEEYYTELQKFHELDWLSFDRLNIKILLSTSTKKYKEQILEFINRILDDLALIYTEKNKTEILVFYKETLNAALSIQEVRKRKAAEKEEKDKIIFKRTQKRKDEIRSLLFVYSDLLRAYTFINDDNIIVTLSDIENLTEEDWSTLITATKEKTITKTTIKEEQQKTVPLKAPIVEQGVETQTIEEEKILVAKFEVKGTIPQLKKLQAFLKDNNYNYQNID